MTHSLIDSFWEIWWFQGVYEEQLLCATPACCLQCGNSCEQHRCPVELLQCAACGQGREGQLTVWHLHTSISTVMSSVTHMFHISHTPHAVGAGG